MENTTKLSRDNIKSNVRLLREMNKLTMREVAAALGIKENTYRVWEDETKISLPKVEYLVQLSKIYNVSVDFIMRSKEDNERRTDTSCVNTSADGIYGDKYLNELSADEKLAAMKMRRMSTADRKRVYDLIDSILDENK